MHMHHSKGTSQFAASELCFLSVVVVVLQMIHGWKSDFHGLYRAVHALSLPPVNCAALSLVPQMIHEWRFDFHGLYHAVCTLSLQPVNCMGQWRPPAWRASSAGCWSTPTSRRKTPTLTPTATTSTQTPTPCQMTLETRTPLRWCWVDACGYGTVETEWPLLEVTVDLWSWDGVWTTQSAALSAATCHASTETNLCWQHQACGVFLSSCCSDSSSGEAVVCERSGAADWCQGLV